MMAKSIWKFNLKADNKQVIEMPLGTVIMSVIDQDDVIVVYGLVNTEETRKQYNEFLICGTGHDLPRDIGDYNFVGTVPKYNSTLIAHIFEVRVR